MYEQRKPWRSTNYSWTQMFIVLSVVGAAGYGIYSFLVREQYTAALGTIAVLKFLEWFWTRDHRSDIRRETNEALNKALNQLMQQFIAYAKCHNTPMNDAENLLFYEAWEAANRLRNTMFGDEFYCAVSRVERVLKKLTDTSPSMRRSIRQDIV